MTLEQTTLFGVRGERWRIGKGSPIAKVPRQAETMWWKCLACGHKWRDLRECKAVCPGGCPACGSRKIMDCNLGSAGCGLLALLLLAAAAFVFAMWIDSLCPRDAVEWIAEYPDPACERCGKVLDGGAGECFEEGSK